MLKIFLFIPILCSVVFAIDNDKDLPAASTDQLKKTKGVTVCTSYVVGATAELNCNGDLTGSTTLIELYKYGWKIDTNIAGGYKFILVLSKSK